MYVLDVERGVDLAQHHLERAAAVFVGDLGPVDRETILRAYLREGLAKTGVPVEDRSPVSNVSALMPASIPSP